MQQWRVGHLAYLPFPNFGSSCQSAGACRRRCPVFGRVQNVEKRPMMQDLMGCGLGGGLAMGFAIVVALLIPVMLLFAIASMGKYIFG